MSNLPPGVRTLGPVYVSEKLKDKYIQACQIEKKLITDQIKEDVTRFVMKHFPDFKEDAQV